MVHHSVGVAGVACAPAWEQCTPFALHLYAYGNGCAHAKPGWQAINKEIYDDREGCTAQARSLDFDAVACAKPHHSRCPHTTAVKSSTSCLAAAHHDGSCLQNFRLTA
jgi:hypothetical protein